MVDSGCMHGSAHPGGDRRASEKNSAERIVGASPLSRRRHDRRKAMLLSIREWHPKHLLLSWSAYWAGLAAVALWPAVGAIRRVAEPGAHGTASASYANGLLKLTIGAEGGTTWEGVASLGTVALWVTVPPLILWGLWLMMRRPVAERGTPAVGAPPTLRALDAGHADEWARRGTAQRDADPVARDAPSRRDAP